MVEDNPLAVRIRDLEFSYPHSPYRLAIDEFDVSAGSTVVIVGPSGSGKSTLLHLIAGILGGHSGSVMACGEQLESLSKSDRRRHRISRIGLVFQEFELLDHLSVRENVILPYLLNPALKWDQAAKARANDLVQGTGIAHQADRSPRKLSQGERQRVALCRALVTEPQLILADEPTGNLDPDTTKRINSLLIEQARRSRATLIMVTHDHSLLGDFDRVVDLTDIADHSRAAGAL